MFNTTQFPGSPPVINLNSNSPTPEPGQHSGQFIGEQPDTTRTYSNFILKLVPKIVQFADHNRGEQLINWYKQRLTKSFKITQYQSVVRLYHIKFMFSCLSIVSL